ncbi:MAG: hypothetical protein JXO44_04155 [Clostridia bacterium]|nr:hypothetical protein [Clostridia bacterium]
MFFEEKLKERLSRYYDVTEAEQVGVLTFDLVARYNQRNAGYVIKKSNEYYAFENNEFILYKKLDKPFTEAMLEEVGRFFKRDSERLLSVHDEHMSSAVTLIFETELPIDEALVKKIQKFNFYKSFRFGFKGWLHGGLMLINPEEGRGLSNKYSKKELTKFLS